MHVHRAADVDISLDRRASTRPIGCSQYAAATLPMIPSDGGRYHHACTPRLGHCQNQTRPPRARKQASNLVTQGTYRVRFQNLRRPLRLVSGVRMAACTARLHDISIVSQSTNTRHPLYWHLIPKLSMFTIVNQKRPESYVRKEETSSFP